MSGRRCSEESVIVAAIRGGGLTDGQRDHLSSCAHCREVSTVAGWLVASAADPAVLPMIPESDALWWRSRIVRELCERDEAVDRRTRPLIVVQGASALLAVIGLMGVALSNDAVNAVLDSAFAGSGQAVGLSGMAAVMVGTALLSLGAAGLVAWRLAGELR